MLCRPTIHSYIHAHVREGEREGVEQEWYGCHVWMDAGSRLPYMISIFKEEEEKKVL